MRDTFRSNTNEIDAGTDLWVGDDATTTKTNGLIASGHLVADAAAIAITISVWPVTVPIVTLRVADVAQAGTMIVAATGCPGDVVVMMRQTTDLHVRPDALAPVAHNVAGRSAVPAVHGVAAGPKTTTKAAGAEAVLDADATIKTTTNLHALVPLCAAARMIAHPLSAAREDATMRQVGDHGLRLVPTIPRVVHGADHPHPDRTT
jgi:hypothetical protein